MVLFYLLSMIPLCVGAGLWLFNKRIVWWEWLIGTACAFILSGIFHYAAVTGMTDDTETWSGEITTAREYSRWKEYYEYAVYRTETIHQTCTDSEGKSYDCSYTIQVFDHWEPTSRWHEEHHKAQSNIETLYSITKDKFNYFCKVFNDRHPVPGKRQTGEHNSRMITGDPNDYVSINRTGVIEPVTKKVKFENRIKAAPTVFSFITVPTNVSVFSWPANPDVWHSERVMGIANDALTIRKWDELNARLGPQKKVNLIIAGFNTLDATMGQYQEAKFIGGKKNDLVIVYGDNNKKPSWVKVFGWTENDVVKRNIESHIIEYGVTTNLYSFLDKEVRANYILKDWSKFDYIAIEPDGSYFYWFFGFLIVTQSGLYVFFHKNGVDRLNGLWHNGLRTFTPSSWSGGYRRRWR